MTSCKPWLAYIAGLVASDGNITCIKRTCKIKIVTSSKKFAEMVREIMTKFCNARIYSTSNREIYEIYCYSKQLANVLILKYELKYGKKSSNIVLPNLDERYLTWYVKGLYDGDSWIGEVRIKLKRKLYKYEYVLPRIVYKSKSRILITQLEGFLRRNKITPYTWRDNEIYALVIDGLKNIKVFNRVIGYMHPDKKRILKYIIKSYYNYAYYGAAPSRGGSA